MEPPSSKLPIEELADFLVRLGQALLMYGSPSHRIEMVLVDAASTRGFDCDVFAVPTGLWLSLTSPGSLAPTIRLTRIYEWSVDLEKLVQVDTLFNEVAAGKLEFQPATEALQEVVQRPAAHGRWSMLGAGCIATAAVALFFGGGLWEVGLSAVLGTIAMAMQQVLGANQRTRLLSDFAIGFLAGLAAWGVRPINAHWDLHIASEPLILAGVVLAVPGMTLTVGLGELAYRQLVSGGARLLQAMMVLLSVIFGIAVATAVESLVDPMLPAAVPVASVPVPFGIICTASIIAGAAFTVIFQVAKRHKLLAALSGLVAGALSFGMQGLLHNTPMATFVAALATGLYANALARRTKAPAQVFLLPGIILLVPGIIGFMGFEHFLAGETAEGLSFAFDALLAGAALVTGLLLANAALPARKLL